ncbi:hypothetical protein RJ639_009690 [Escallonia herrerae]|uniref:Uncharacterized protein n=1 Tax=Escallonia herrerae TaxID=1293975 RepID=A0AA88VUN2_9ASTE|nr:hypothetical protein RJ639_009690 [Escallonia herrerae]
MDDLLQFMNGAENDPLFMTVEVLSGHYVGEEDNDDTCLSEETTVGEQNYDIGEEDNVDIGLQEVNIGESGVGDIGGDVSEENESMSDLTMKIKRLGPEHTCGKTDKNYFTNSALLAKRYVNDFRSNPKWPLYSIRETIKRDFGVKLGKAKCYRSRAKAKKMIMGSSAEQYAKLEDLFHPGLVEEDIYYFELMEYGIDASCQHDASMVDLHGRTGKLQEAVSIFKDMPIQPMECMGSFINRVPDS